MNVSQTNEDTLPAFASFPRTTHESAIPPQAPSSNVSSVGPSRSAFEATLNHDREEQPPSDPVTIHSWVTNAPAFGEPISPFIAITTTVSHGACTTSRVQHTPPSFSLWQHHHRILHALQRRHTCHLRTRNRHLCASHTDLRGRWRKELERRQREKEESTPVVKEENRKISPFPHRHDRSESHAAPAIQQPVVEQEQQVQGVSAVPPSPSEGPPPSKAMDSLPVLLQKGGLSVA
jgi:hypothetical protein